MTAAPFDLDTYLVQPPATGRARTRRTHGRRSAPSGLFIGGKLPWEVAVKASHLPGATVRLCLVLQLLRKLEGTRTVLLRRQYVKDLAVEPQAERRALAHLEKAGLIGVERHRGRRPRVTLHWDDDGLLGGEP